MYPGEAQNIGRHENMRRTTSVLDTGSKICSVQSKPSRTGSMIASLITRSSSISGYRSWNSRRMLPKWPRANPGKACTRSTPVGEPFMLRIWSTSLPVRCTRSAHSW